MSKVALYVLNAGLVLDRSVFVSQPVAEMEVTLGAIRATPKKTLTVIENALTFFTAANMLDIIKTGGDGYRLIAEKAGVTLRDEDVRAIVTAEATKKAIEASMVPPKPPYTFAAIPEGWSVATDLSITVGKSPYVRRRRVNTNGNGTGYSISLGQLKRIWAVAAPRWLTGGGPGTVPGTRADGYSRTASVSVSRVIIGCQDVQRYELEQLALHLGWEFPAAKPAEK